MPATGRVFVRNVYGNVRIAVWDRPEIKIVSVKTADSREKLKTVEIVVQNQPNRLCIASKYDSGRSLKEWLGIAADPCGDPPKISGARSQLATVDYTISLPRSAGLVVISSEGDVDIQGTAGSLFVDIEKGHLTALDISGDCKLYGSYSGVNVTLNTLALDTHIESAVGPLVVRLASSISARIHAISGGRIVENDFGWSTGPNKKELQATLGGGKTLLDLSSSGGRVEIHRLTPPQPQKEQGKSAPPARGKKK